VNEDGKNVTLSQVVVREPRPPLTIYNYDKALLEKLKVSKMQYSFMLVHEWLWDYLDNAPAIRDTNGYLHSEEFFQSTPETTF
jgi:hypothetical protein